MIFASSAGTQAGNLSMIVLLVGMFAIMYFMMIRPQRKEQKRVTEMLNSMEIGDAVITSSGFYGIIIDISESDVIVEFGNNKNCRIPMTKEAIRQVEKPEQAAAIKEETKKEAKESKK
ncbi:MAG: preprotein translocase subunit YajC [Eubacteriales bacterium]|nr:preprotein translocase subunit YajC [Eubacteriales bacterium]